MSKFIQLSADDDTKNFLSHCVSQYESPPLSRYVKSILRKPLGLFLGHTDVNAFLTTGRMFVFSTSQFRALMAPWLQSRSEMELKALRCLDIGAGDGGVTAQLAPVFHEVVTTEVSSHMVKQLRQRGFTCHEVNDVADVPRGEGFDVISLLNVIDRCDRPRTLLQNVKRLLRSSDSCVVVATPLPLNPWVERGTSWVRPTESIGRIGCCHTDNSRSWEECASHLVEDFVEPLGFEVVNASRVPYISEGDLSNPYYILDDCLLVLRARNDTAEKKSSSFHPQDSTVYVEDRS